MWISDVSLAANGMSACRAGASMLDVAFSRWGTGRVTQASSAIGVTVTAGTQPFAGSAIEAVGLR